MKNKITRLGIVDDHQIVIDGLKSLLHGHDQFEVLIECTQPLQMISLIEKNQAVASLAFGLDDAFIVLGEVVGHVENVH